MSPFNRQRVCCNLARMPCTVCHNDFCRWTNPTYPPLVANALIPRLQKTDWASLDDPGGWSAGACCAASKSLVVWLSYGHGALCPQPGTRASAGNAAWSLAEMLCDLEATGMCSLGREEGGGGGGGLF